MRILCLHGKGCSGAVFRSQTEMVRKYLEDMDIDYDFPNAPFSSAPATGVDVVYDPPYYAFWQNDNLQSIQDACTWLRSYIAQNGPYDAIFAFSQGGILLSSALLLDQAMAPDQASLIKAAVFFSGGPPLTVMDSLGFEIPEDTWSRDRVSRLSLDVNVGARKTQDKWVGPSLEKGEITEEELRDEIAGPYSISIPTLHFYGTKDPRFESSVELSGLCDAAKMKLCNHQGTHDIPRKNSVSENMASALRGFFEDLRDSST
ncbi:hypothetical protein FE257_012976 [Aspergillus nanangensis]|uniref:Serine hydrolase domain-containing protein n=1 Tax=Aspergillus nanangensis TaxID=2582783 RepID=A0AAD4GPL0_ASPNN|nr:hypothetical protein FE257_012976 [Aspergillus nanangensis]